ncbi:MAG: L-serine ammonia-lyase, iron-sulfur-dependent subunit beta [Clostridium sp.]|uniref:L-serine ammonia-lyase, iron-sulfur-dependent subunit beta n=1 Tax=Clostridium sp. TaxID=1506 RepID=UPI002FCA4CDB
MKNYSVFDVLGPVMIGPSSSHTAGAARLGKIARGIVGSNFKRVEFYLHGSFAETYKGHGTDRALVAGILGMDTHDERLRSALEIAEGHGIDVKFIKTDLGEEHPNTVRMVFYMNDGGISEITGSSIGGGSIVVTDIDGEQVEFTGLNPTVIIRQKDIVGLVSRISTIMVENNIGIATMKMGRNGKDAFVILETDTEIPENVIESIKTLPDIMYVKVININK